MSIVEITAAECRKQADKCLQRREEPGISPRLSTLLLTMARTWTALASLKERVLDSERGAD